MKNKAYYIFKISKFVGESQLYPVDAIIYLNKDTADKACAESNAEAEDQAEIEYQKRVFIYLKDVENYTKAFAAGVTGVHKPIEPKKREPDITYHVGTYDFMEI